MGMPNSGSLLAYDFSTTRVLLAMDVFCIICILFFFQLGYDVLIPLVLLVVLSYYAYYELDVRGV